MSPSFSLEEVQLDWTEEEWAEIEAEAKTRGVTADDVIAELAMEALVGKAQAHRLQIAPKGRLRVVK